MLSSWGPFSEASHAWSGKAPEIEISFKFVYSKIEDEKGKQAVKC